MHVVEALVDVVKVLRVGDKFVDPQGSVEVIINDTRDLGSSLDTAERRSLPDSTGDQLEPVLQLESRMNTQITYGRVEISAPAGATPMMLQTPQPLWQHSSASRITPTYR